MQLCVTLIVTHRTPGTRQHESGSGKVGISAAAAWTRGPVPGCLWLWARLYQAVLPLSVPMVCTVAGYSVWPGYGGGGACDS